MTRPARFTANLALLGVSLAVGCLLAEALVRLVHDSPSRARNHHLVFCEYDPVLGWRKKPGVSGKHVSREFAVTETMNSKGLRGPEHTYDKPPGTFRILVLGDSFAEGHTVELEELFSRRLERELTARTGRPVEVINSGTAGWSTDQELLFFETEGVKYGPDWTLLLFHDNDVWFNHQHRYWRAEKPLFVLDNGALRLTNVPTPRSTPRWPGRTPGATGTGGPSGPLAVLRHWLVRNSHASELVRDRVRFTPALRRIWLRLAAPSARPPASRVPLPDEWQVYLAREPEPVAAAWEVTTALIERLARGASQAGSRLSVFHVPPAESLYADRLAVRRDAYGLAPDEWEQGRVLDRLSGACSRLGVELIDPDHFSAAARRAESAGGPRLYFEVDGHWNRDGHRAAALVLADHLAPALAPPGRLR